MLRGDFFTFENMKSIVTGLIVLVVVCGCEPGKKKIQSEVRAVPAGLPLNRVKIEEKVGYDTLTQFVAGLAREKDLDAGKRSIIRFLEEHYPSFNPAFLNNTDLHAFREEMLKCIEAPLTDSPPGDDIQALYFGLFISDRPQFSPSKRPVTIIYLTGSKRTPAMDPEGWTNDPAYFPEEEYYIIPDTFTAINRELDAYTQTDQIEEVIFSGILNMIIGNAFGEIRKYSGLDDFYVGAGFDEATIFVLGRVR